MNRATKIRCQLGLSVAMIAVFCIIMTEVLRETGYYEMYKWYFCAALLALGSLLWILGRCRSGKTPSSGKTESTPPLLLQDEVDSEVRHPFFLASLSFWGLLLIAFGVIVIFIVPDPGKSGQAGADSDNNSQAAASVRPTPLPEAPGDFPTLKVQGVVFRKANPSVLINGRTLFVGDYVEHAKVISIESDQVTVEWNGHRRIFLRPD